METIFKIQGQKMLFWRLGNMNSNKQYHKSESSHADVPIKRGIWCFPYPHYDYFFCYHQWEKLLPKIYRDENKMGIENGNDIEKYLRTLSNEEKQDFFNKKAELIKKIQKENPPKTFWYGGKFYSHINIHGKTDYESWYLWDNVKQWANVAKKTVYLYEKYNGEIHKMEYTKDHLEIFIPNFS